MSRKCLEENAGSVRVGVYVCHCGVNIAGVVDVKKVVECISKLPNVVVAKDYLYVCSDAGQMMISQDIKEHNLNRVVVAACSPNLHEQTFRKCLESGGLNKYLLVMANIREHCSWVHSDEPEEATAKAIDLVRMAVARANLLEPLESIRVPVKRSCLVIGGGIAGIQAALDIANEGFEVYLVEKNVTIGGHMAQFDKTFPTMDCSMCILSPKMAEVAHHPKIHLLTNAEVKRVSGYVGNFKVEVEIKPRYVIDKLCNGCGECAKVCPIEVPNEFDEGIGLRKAIFIPFPQAVPLVYTVDIENCIQCYKCVDACLRSRGESAINFSQESQRLEIEVGTIIVATGYDVFDPSVLEVYGYGVYEDVMTALELERVLAPTGPTQGKILRISDGTTPKRIAFIQCVGSRDENTNPYCSRVCCMYATKQALLIKERIPDAEILIFYIDVRAAGKGYEEFYKRAQNEGIRYVRGKVADVSKNRETKKLVIKAEDTLLGAMVETEVDLVVLSIGLIPSKATKVLSEILGLSLGPDKFFKEAHPKLRPVDTLVDGIFIAGAAQGPKDIPDSVAQASATAQKASILMSAGEYEVEAVVARVDEDLCSKCLICVPMCPFNAIVAEEKTVKIIDVLCKGCGACAAACPTKAIDAKHFKNEQILAEIKAALSVGEVN
ncbi:MAG: CoB--CoM heterodisulfide reductase iron-sulfur subunit A family protein [Candidatus Bathyarchaeia archaeon]